MLRMMNDKETSEVKMNKLHQQLDEINKNQTLNPTRVREAKIGSTKDDEWGLLDSKPHILFGLLL